VIVLWGKRRGDVQYGSRDFWRRNLPVGDLVLTVDRAVFDVGDLFLIDRTAETFCVTGIEGERIAVVPL
jgi:hypothetical protein